MASDARFSDYKVTAVVEDIEVRRKSRFSEKIIKNGKRSTESEEEKQRKGSKEDECLLKASGSSSERESDDIFTSAEEQIGLSKILKAQLIFLYLSGSSILSCHSIKTFTVCPLFYILYLFNSSALYLKNQV